MCKINDENPTPKQGEPPPPPPEEGVFRNQKWVLTRRPQGHFQADTDCQLLNERIDLSTQPLVDDEVLIRVTSIGIDAFIRVMLNDVEDAHGGKNRVHGGVNLGDVIPANAIGRVVQSGPQSTFVPGTMVTGLFGGQMYLKTRTKTTKNSTSNSPPLPMRVLSIPRVPEHKFLSLFSISGITAYVGIHSVMRHPPRKGETVVVTAAAGGTGSIAAQLAKLKGSRVIGVTGGWDKCRFLTEDLGLDGAINYKDQSQESLRQQFEQHCPNGIDFLYDNVGGECLNEALHHIAKHGRAVVCGAIAGYNDSQHQGPSNYIRLAEQSATMSGFVVLHYPFSMLMGFVSLVWLYFRGKVDSYEQLYHEGGIHDFPKALQNLFHGRNIGKPIIQL
jgi:NADPH-dependent curcumin reductase CurA